MADKRISQLVERTDIANNDVVPIVASGATTTNKATISSIQEFMQENLDLGVTSVGITLGTTGTDVNVTGSPITTSGNITINLPTASATNRGLLSSADWSTFNSKQPAGNYVTLDTTQTITAQKTFTTSGSSDTMIISHGSGSGYALDVIKAGNGEAIRVQKTSGSGNAMTISGGNFEAGTIVKTGGTSAQFLKADGSVDANTYLTTSSASAVYVPYTGANSSVNLGQFNLSASTINVDGSGPTFGSYLGFKHSTSVTTGADGYTSMYTFGTNTIAFKSVSGSTNKDFSFSMVGLTANVPGGRVYTLPDASGTLALTTDLGAYLPLAGGTLTGALGGTSLNFSGDIQTATRLISATGGEQILINANNGGSSNRIETTGTLPLSLVSAAAITLAAGGTTPQITLATTGAVTLTGALNGTSASFTGAVTSVGGFINGSDFRYNPLGNTNGNPVLVLKNPSSGVLSIASEIIGDANVNSNSLAFSVSNPDQGRFTALTIASTGAATFSSSVTAKSLKVENTGTASFLYFNNTSAPASNYIALGSAANEMYFQVNGADRLVIKDNGNVGIGTASPSAPLTITSNASGDNTRLIGRAADGFSFLTFRNNADTTTNGNIGVSDSQNMIFYTSTTERMRITSAGDVMIGNALSPVSSRGELRIGGNSAGSRISMGISGTNYSALVTDSGGNVYLVNEFNDSAIKLLMINFNNGVYLSQSATSWTSNSDERLKNINGTIENAVDKLMTLRAVNYSWKNDENQKENLGLIAQDVEKVFPEVIDSNTLTNLDENEDADKTEYLGVRYQELVPVLIKAIQELKTEIDSLKNQIK